MCLWVYLPCVWVCAYMYLPRVYECVCVCVYLPSVYECVCISHMCVYVCISHVCVYVCVSSMCLGVSMKTRGGHEIPWTDLCWKPISCIREEQQGLLTTEPALQPLGVDLVLWSMSVLQMRMRSWLGRFGLMGGDLMIWGWLPYSTYSFRRTVGHSLISMTRLFSSVAWIEPTQEEKSGQKNGSPSQCAAFTSITKEPLTWSLLLFGVYINLMHLKSSLARAVLEIATWKRRRDIKSDRVKRTRAIVTGCL